MSLSSADYKKALKTLDGEKRAALKKAKALKGPKGKEAQSQVEQDYELKLQALQAQYKSTTTNSSDGGAEAVGNVEEEGGGGGSDSPASVDPQQLLNQQAEEDRQKKLIKIQRKKEKQRQKELERLKEEEELAANAGPNYKQIEWDQIQAHLQSSQLRVKQVVADGHCLYRAIGGQTGKTYNEVRSLCADTLALHPDDFAPFCEYPSDEDEDEDKTNENGDGSHHSLKYGNYVSKVRSSAEWGGHLELRALAMAFRRTILVYQSDSPQPLEIVGGLDEDDSRNTSHVDEQEPIRLSYHKHYYALGEHYNQVVPMKGGDPTNVDDDQK